MVETRGQHRYDPDYTVPPGEVLEEVLEARNMKKVDLAKRCGLSAKTVSQILGGKAPISSETAIQLERVLGVSARIWANLETNYRLSQAKMMDVEQLGRHKDWLERFPVGELVERKFIEDKGNDAEMVRELLNFFGVGSVAAWEQNVAQMQVVFHHSPSVQSSPEAVAAWLRIGEVCAEKIDCKPYEKVEFEKALAEIRKMTRKNPRAFEPRMKELCRQAGVALVFISGLPKTGISGAARWLSKDKALVMLSLRYKADDHFWFSFFHEAGHILLHSKKSIFLEAEEDEVFNNLEKQANEYAADTLIPPGDYESLVVGVVENRCCTIGSLQDFASRLRIAPGIVVGRLQHDGHVPWQSFNHLKRKFHLVENCD